MTLQQGARRLARGGSLLCWLAIAWPLAADEPVVVAAQEQLAELRDLVGEWRGVGQPRRGSSRGSWQENVAWQFRFEEGRPTLIAESSDARWMGQARLAQTEKPREYRLEIEAPQGAATKSTEKQLFSGTSSEEAELVFVADKPQPGGPDRISFRLVAGGDRLVLLYETKGAGERYARLAEVGFTRRGVNFGQATYPECVVTGGRGTIGVEHDGKTYYVCCSGCRDLFLESPAEILAEYQRRKAAEK